MRKHGKPFLVAEALALLAIIFATIVVHIIHPRYHEIIGYHCVIAQRCADARAPSFVKEDSTVVSGEHHCEIDAFLTSLNMSETSPTLLLAGLERLHLIRVRVQDIGNKSISHNASDPRAPPAILPFRVSG